MSDSDIMHLVVSIISVIATAGGVYAAIRSDIARLHEKAERAIQAAEHAHERIDRLMQARSQ